MKPKKKIRNLDFSSEKQAKQKKMRSFIIAFSSFVIILGTISVFIFMKSVDFNLNNLVQSTTIKLKEAGTLPDRIDASKKYLITNLKLVGEINGTDFRMIREMAGSDYYGGSTEGNLSVLDLSEAKIVIGGGFQFV